MSLTTASCVHPHGARLVLLTIATATGMLLAALDASIVGTAMPTVVASLGGLEIFSWVFSGYALVSTTAMPIFGRLSDVYGRKRLYLFGLGVFVVASGLCGASQNMIQLIAFRALQGIGGAAIFALTFAIIGDLYPPEKRGSVQGVISSMWAIAAIVGPALGALLTETVGWRWVFLVNLPVSLLPIVSLGVMLRERPREAVRTRVDVAGASALAAAIVVVLLGAQWGGKTVPWLSPQMLVLAGAVAALVLAFVRIQRRAPMPTIPLELFRDRMFVLGSLANVAFGWTGFTVTAFTPLFVQGVLGGGAGAAGVAIIPMSLGWSLSSSVGGPLVKPLGYRRMCLIGFTTMLLGYGLMLRLGPGSSLYEVIVPTGIVGLGCGFCAISLLLAVQNSVGEAQLGVATSLVMFFRNVGLAIGVSVLGAVQVARLEERYGGPVADVGSLLLGRDVDPVLRAALAGSVHDAWLGAVAVLALAMVLATRMTGWQARANVVQASGAIGE